MITIDGVRFPTPSRPSSGRRLGAVMIEWLGIGHLFELSRTEAIAGFFTPLVDPAAQTAMDAA